MSKMFTKMLVVMILFLGAINVAQAYSGENKEILLDRKGIKITENGKPISINSFSKHDQVQINLMQNIRNNLSVISNNPNYTIKVVYDGSTTKMYRNGILYNDDDNEVADVVNNDVKNVTKEANPNDYSVKVYPQVADNNSNKNELDADNNAKDNSIKYDVFDITKGDFNDDVKRNCIQTEKIGLSVFYKCSNEQFIILSKSLLFSKKTIAMDKSIFFISDMKYSYIIYGLLLLLLLILL